MYGCRLRIKDINFAYNNVYIYDSKSQKHRVLPLPKKIIEELKIQIEDTRRVHQEDLSNGFGYVNLPYGLEKSIQTHTSNSYGNTYLV